jgi:peptidoglycan/LPS O-acetylase OafA/YrhL
MVSSRSDLSSRSETLDALRGLAVSMVVARHLFDFKYGMLGVDLFFVISGFLIGGILLDNRDQPGYFSSFYGRRAFRILPLYCLLLLIVPPDHWQFYLLFAQAIPWLQHGYPSAEPTFVTWTLAIEEQFYLILPMLIYWLPRQRLIKVLWAGVLLAPIWRYLFHSYLPTQSWQYLMPGRLDELFGGVLLACYVRGYCSNRIGWLVLACIPPLLDVTCALLIRPVSFLSVAAFACFVMVWASTHMQRPVILRPFIWPGQRCYALYLFHMLVFDLFFDFGFPYAGLVALPIVCILAEISWRVIEAPLIEYARKRFVRIEPAISAAQVVAAT